MVTADELKELPLRAVVAFAARCARRIQPLFRRTEGLPAKAKHDRAVEQAISAAESFANGVLNDYGDDAAARAVAAYAAVTAEAAEAAAAEAFEAEAVATAAADASAAPAAAVRAARAAAAAVAAARSAAAAARSAAEDDAEVVARVAFNAYVQAEAASLEALAAEALTAEAADHDLAALKWLQLGRYPEFGASVDPSEDGPLGNLWPGEPPAWYVKPPRQEELRPAGPAEPPPPDVHPSLAIVWDPDVLSAEEYADLVTALGDLARAEGGLGIQRVRSRGFGVPCGDVVPHR